MTKAVVLTARIDDALSAQLDELAGKLDRSRSWLIAEAVRRYVTDETAFIAFVQEGLDDLDAGRVISHEDLIRQLRDRHATKRAA